MGDDGRLTLTVERLTDYGNETLRVEPPAVVTALKDANVPRLPSLGSQIRARRAQPDRWGPEKITGDPEQFGLDGSPTRVVRVFTPPPRGECTRLEGEPDQVAARLAGILKARSGAP